MNHLPPMPHGPPHHHGRRQNEYHYQGAPPAHLGPPHHIHYPNYHQPSQYHGPPQVYPYMQWYHGYQQYPPPAPRMYHPPTPATAPLIVSSHPHAQPLPPLPRPAPLPMLQPVHTPQFEHSTTSSASQTLLSPSTTPTTTSITTTPAQLAAKPVTDAPPSIQSAASTPSLPPQTSQRTPFYPPLPWLSVPAEPFPPKGPRRARRRRLQQLSSKSLELPSRTFSTIQETEASAAPKELSYREIRSDRRTALEEADSKSELPGAEPDLDRSSSDLLSETSRSATLATTSTNTHKRAATKPIIPIVPIIPVKSATAAPAPKQLWTEAATVPTINGESVETEEVETESDHQTTSPASPLITTTKATPKSWAELLRSKGPVTNGVGSVPTINQFNGIGNGAKAGSLADALQSYTVENNDKISFLEPRGLVNTGNMCYMNSILQILVFCVPFYDFLSQIGKRAVHNFKSDTPLIEAMIMFMREFSVIDSATSVEQLRLRLKDNELEQYGEPFIPEYVYEVINRLPRFSSMRRGHQQDAEEFLGFLLEGLHDECVHILKQSIPETGLPQSYDTSTSLQVDQRDSSDGGWLEVGPKQKAAVTRSSGAISMESSITKIFGGKLRSEFRVPGLKKSVTLEPYQPLQLDIGASDILNITDALKGLTRSETIHGDFSSPRGPGTHATKQVFIETLPPVLILHLKRFQYDNAGGTQKIWKKIGYPLELEIPKEVLPPHTRGNLALRPGGLPKYRLIGVVYHHGKNASGGHYTVDVRRQEGREWIRFDDTVVRRVRSEDVSREGGEEDPKILVKALEEHKRNQNTEMNIYKQAGFENEDSEADMDNHNGWSQVNGNVASPTATNNPSRKWAGVVVNGGTSTPSTTGKQTPRSDNKGSIRDNKVAYILFYQQIKT